MKAGLAPEQLEKLAALQVKLPREFQVLELTDEQQSAIWRILKTSFRSNGLASAKIRFLRAELQDLLLFSQDADQTRIVEVQQAITDEEMKLEKSRIDMMLQVRDVLTPEQRERYQKIRLRRQPDESENPSAQNRRKGNFQKR
jgi:Spy/CpxP family protein refolding chaperone